MYRLVLYLLIALIGVACILAFFKFLPFSPLALLASSLFLTIICWGANIILTAIFDVPANIESAPITALILALIIDPIKTPADLQFLGWAAILAMSSKYILSLHDKHLFNPAAIAVVITSFALRESASWWIGTMSMAPFVLVGGILVTRKLRQADMVLSFCATVFVIVCSMSLIQKSNLLTEIKQLFILSPLLFFAFVMLTEPLTAPHKKVLRRIYAILVGILFIPQLHIGSIYSTPELALVVGNVFAYLVSPKQKVALKLNQKIKMAPGILDFVFKPSQKLAFVPGQYMEFTLAHPHPDSRGNRRYFTIASSPTEKNMHLGIRFYDQGSSFKNAMYRMDGKTKIMAAQIAGDFTLPEDFTQKLVFIAGGIGITPFRSMLKYLLDSHQRRDIILIYVNKTVNEIVYKDILNKVQAQLHIRIIYVLTDLTAIPQNWTGLVGRLNQQMLMQVVPDYAERTYYLSGPPNMVDAYEQVLENIDIKHKYIRKDFFPGLV